MEVYGNVKELLAKDINLKQLLGLLENEDRSEKEETLSRSSSFTGQGKNLEVMASFIELIFWLTMRKLAFWPVQGYRKKHNTHRQPVGYFPDPSV